MIDNWPAGGENEYAQRYGPARENEDAHQHGPARENEDTQRHAEAGHKLGKRQRPEDVCASPSPGLGGPISLLCHLPAEVLDQVLSFLDSATLANMTQVSRTFRTRDRANHLSLVEKVAHDQLMRAHGSLELAARWRHCSWVERLSIEEAVTLFDRTRCEKQGFQFTTDAHGTVTGVKLEGIGPRLLLSDVTTAEVPLLRWRLELKGNNAVEFGTVPVSLQDQPKALHKCYNVDGARPSGFCSAITVGSMLPVKLPLMRGSVVEILASKDRLQYIVTNPSNGMEMLWHNTITVPKPYKGPLQFRFEQDLQPGQAVKLAVTCWARAALEVLHTQPGKGRHAWQDLQMKDPQPEKEAQPGQEDVPVGQTDPAAAAADVAAVGLVPVVAAGEEGT